MNIVDILLTHAPALTVAIPLFGAFLTPLISRVSETARNIFAICIIAITALFVLLMGLEVLANGPITYVFGSTAATVQGSTVVRILFQIDALSILMALIGVILASVAVLYSYAFIKRETGLDKYYTLLLLMTAGMLGMMLTGDLFNFFVFLEITSISSAALVAFWTNKAKAVEAGFKYIVISTIAALFFLLAVSLLYGQYNALNMAKIAESIGLTGFSFLDKIALVLFIAALGMKGGLAPMHMWVPDAYGKAPAPISLLLVGVTQASLYGVFRMVFTVYGDVISFPPISIGWILVLLGLVTMLIGVIMAIIQTDFKRLIGYGAVAELGYIALAIGTGLTIVANTDPMITVQSAPFAMKAITGGLFHLINDALDIGLLFLVAGAVYYVTKETSMNKLGGLARNMKYTTVFFIIGLLAVSGLPPFNGFASKLLIYESTYQLNPILSIVAILSSILLLAIFVKVLHSVFLGPALPQFSEVKEVPKSMLAAMAIIAGIIIMFGLFPQLIVTHLIEPAANALVDNTAYLQWLTGGL